MKYDTIGIQINCNQPLPDILLQYLWEIADRVQGESVHTFLLTTHQLGGLPVQMVLHCAGEHREWHKLYGFEPVDAHIRIVLGDGDPVSISTVLTLEQSGIRSA